MRDIKTQEGARGLFRGHSATLLRIFPYAAIKFQAYEQIRAVLIPGPKHETPIRRLLSGSAAGVTSVFFTYPLEVIRVRLAFETKVDGNGRGTLSRICKQIYSERPPAPAANLEGAVHSVTAVSSAVGRNTVEAGTSRGGLVNFYRGFTPTLLGMVPYAGMSFLTHDTVGDWLRLPAVAKYTTVQDPSITAKDGRKRLTHPAELASGAAAGLISQTASYPLEVIRRRMQVGGAVGDGTRLRIGETATKIWAQQGWKGFFVGLSIGYLKVIPMAAISFWTYESGKIVLGI